MPNIDIGDMEGIRAGAMLRELPEAFWDVATWNAVGDSTYGCVDVADRKRIITRILRLADRDAKNALTTKEN